MVRSAVFLEVVIACKMSSNFSYALHKKPEYIADPIMKKYGRNGEIFILGASQDHITKFWKHVGYAVHPDSPGISPPVEKGRTVVNIESKCHINDAKKAMEDDAEHEGKTKKPSDWYDAFQITSKKSKGESRTKSYSLQVGKTTEKSVGGGASLKISTPGFFNVAGGGITPELGINANYSKIKDRKEGTGEKKKEKLSQAYELVDTLKVPPQTKTKVTITTWAVTHESDVKIRVTVDSKAGLPIKYRTHLSQLFGGLSTSTGYLTAKDIFENKEDFNDDGVNITFSSMSTISYVGEDVEIIKEELPFPCPPTRPRRVKKQQEQESTS